MKQQFVSTVLDFVAQTSPLILAALGGLVSEYAGVLNIGLEGLLLNGAFSAIVGASLSGGGIAGLLVGIAFALASGFCWGMVMSIVIIRLKGSIFITGLALNLLVAGGVSVLSSAFFGTRSVIILDPAHIAPAGLPEMHFALLSLCVGVGLWFFVRNTRKGLQLRVAGNDAEMMRERGVDTERIQWWALVASCMLASLGGAALSLQLGSFVPNQSAGQGWIALVLIFVGGRNPLGIVAGSIVFVLAERTAFAAQSTSAYPALFVGMPFLLVLAALVLVHVLRYIMRR